MDGMCAEVKRRADSQEKKMLDAKNLPIGKDLMTVVIFFQLSIHKYEDDVANSFYLLVMKGAPERIIDRCSSILIEGIAEPVSDEWKEEFNSAYEELGNLGERVLGFADFPLPKDKFPELFEFDSDTINFPIDGLRFLGLVSLIDPPRPNVPMAIKKCRDAGIRVVMVTGDHPSTAEAIARIVGIIGEESETPQQVALRTGLSEDKVDPA